MCVYVAVRVCVCPCACVYVSGMKRRGLEKLVFTCFIWTLVGKARQLIMHLDVMHMLYIPNCQQAKIKLESCLVFILE